MCGLTGYAGTHQPELLQAMVRTLAHRGPDHEGMWTDENAQVGLAHRRLSIIDLSAAAHQPMCTPDGSLVLAYNGEIYNFPELRASLEAGGVAFHSHSDTEVLLRLYERDGLDALARLNGMFAFALWDQRRNRLVLARDHAGIKPLYYCQHAGVLYFASEVKALLQVPGLPRRLNPEAVVDYLTFLWVPGADAMIEGIRKLEPGHHLVWEAGKLTVRRWFHMDYDPDPGPGEDEWIEAIRTTFTRAATAQMISDVPLGAFLSGGLDSSSILAAMRSAFPDREIRAYSARFPPGEMAAEQGVDDQPFAEAVARHLGLQLVSVDIRPDVISLLPRMVYHLDEPDADPAIFPSYLIARQAREDGLRVLLSGTGGDEVFFGYRSHAAIRRIESMQHLPRPLLSGALGIAAGLTRRFTGASAPLARRLAKFRRAMQARSPLERHLALTDWSAPEVRERLLGRPLRRAVPPCLLNYSAAFSGHGNLNHHSHLLTQTFLAAHNFLYTDKSSMAASIEVRVPFMDLEVMRLAARIPERLMMRNNVTKYLLKRAMEPWLPRQVIYRPKAGFGAPLRKWIHGDMAGVVTELLSPARVRARGLFDPQAIDQLRRESVAGRADHSYLLYALVNLEVWQQTFVDRAGELVVV